MKRIIGVCLSLTALWVLGACGNTNASQAQDVNTAKLEPNATAIQGARIVETVTDERVIEAMRQESPLALCSSPHTATIDAVQIEEFEGRKYLTVLARDENGQCMSGSQDYEPDAMPGYAPPADPK